MVRPISLSLRHARAIDQAETTLIAAGRADDVKRARAARIMRTARATVERAQEQKRLKRCAALAAQKAIVLVQQAYQAQDRIDASEFERAAWYASRAAVLDELTKIAQGRRP